MCGAGQGRLRPENVARNEGKKLHGGRLCGRQERLTSASYRVLIPRKLAPVERHVRRVVSGGTAHKPREGAVVDHALARVMREHPERGEPVLRARIADRGYAGPPEGAPPVKRVARRPCGPLRGGVAGVPPERLQGALVDHHLRGASRGVDAHCRGENTEGACHPTLRKSRCWPVVGWMQMV